MTTPTEKLSQDFGSRAAPLLLESEKRLEVFRVEKNVDMLWLAGLRAQ